MRLLIMIPAEICFNKWVIVPWRWQQPRRWQPLFSHCQKTIQCKYSLFPALCLYQNSSQAFKLYNNWIVLASIKYHKVTCHCFIVWNYSWRGLYLEHLKCSIYLWEFDHKPVCFICMRDSTRLRIARYTFYSWNCWKQGLQLYYHFQFSWFP